MQTTDLGRAFFHVIHVKPGTPPLHMADTVEIEEPYRSSRSLIVRLPFGLALVLGWWRDTDWSEEDALLKAVEGWGLNPYDDSIDSLETKAIIRKNVAAQTKDLDTEWQIIQALGVDS